MPNTLSANWWAIVLRGAIAILFGILTMAIPGATLLALIVLFGAYCLLEGTLNVVAAVRGMRGRERWAPLLLEGLVSIAAGVVTFLWPGLTTLALVYVIAVWALVTGVFEIVAAVRLRKQIRGEWLLALSGVVSLAFGVLLIMSPPLGALALIFWIGAYAVVFGVLVVALGIRVHSWGSTHPTMHPLEGV
jgi:uncharacterized membrane protein HdeD (DUF308 family)